MERRDLIDKARKKQGSIKSGEDEDHNEGDTSIKIALGLDNNSYEVKRKDSGDKKSRMNETHDGLSIRSRLSEQLDQLRNGH